MDRFIELFEGNHDAFGLEEGGCAHIHPDSWELALRTHLTGEAEPIGVYPMVHNVTRYYDDGYAQRLNWGVKWGCVDFDQGEEESWVHAKNVHLALTTFGITGWIERSRSKGFHVWVFAQDWVEAKLMRRALLAACQLVEAPTREINPKQEELKDGQLGNYVRLPYPGHLRSVPAMQDALNAGTVDVIKRVMVFPEDARHSYHLMAYVNDAYANRTDVAALSSIAAHYAPPETQVIYRDWSNSVMQGSAIDRLRGKALVIFQQGPLEGSDRSDTLWKLARYLKEDGRHTVDEALELLRDADRRWGKFYDRPDGEQRLTELIQRAWF